jgi:hypothetical protein
MSVSWIRITWWSEDVNYEKHESEIAWDGARVRSGEMETEKKINKYKRKSTIVTKMLHIQYLHEMMSLEGIHKTENLAQVEWTLNCRREIVALNSYILHVNLYIHS